MMRCPVTHSGLTPASESDIENMNVGIANGEVFDRLGRAITESIEAGLVNAEGNLLMPIRGGIVTLIADESIVIESKTESPTEATN